MASTPAPSASAPTTMPAIIAAALLRTIARQVMISAPGARNSSMAGSSSRHGGVLSSGAS